MEKKRRSKKVKRHSNKIKKQVREKSSGQKITKVSVSEKQIVSDPELEQELSALDDLRNYKTKPKENLIPKKETMDYKTDDKIPTWFYFGSIIAAYLFTIYMSIFAALHFENIEFMKITIIFLFVSMVLFFLISAIYFISERKAKHYFAPILFFISIVAIMIYAFKANDTSNLLRYTISYTIIVATISIYYLSHKR